MVRMVRVVNIEGRRGGSNRWVVLLQEVQSVRLWGWYGAVVGSWFHFTVLIVRGRRR